MSDSSDDEQCEPGGGCLLPRDANRAPRAPSAAAPDDAARGPCLSCADCGHVLVRATHVRKESSVPPGEGHGPPRTLSVFGEAHTCYPAAAEHSRAGGPLELLVATREDAVLPSASGWVSNPLAAGQGLRVEEAAHAGRAPPPGPAVDFERTWFKGHTARPAACARCAAPRVAWLFEPDLQYSLMAVAGQALGATLGAVPFWGLDVRAVREHHPARGSTTPLVHEAAAAAAQSGPAGAADAAAAAAAGAAAASGGSAAAPDGDEDVDSILRAFAAQMGGVYFETSVHEGEGGEDLNTIMGALTSGKVVGGTNTG